MVALVFRPLAMALFLAGVLAMALAPLHRKLTSRLWGRSRLAAGLLVLGVLLVVLAPLVSLSAFVVREAAEAYGFVTNTLRSQGVEGLIAHLPDVFERPVRELLEHVPAAKDGSLTETVQEQVTAQGGSAAAAVGSAVAATGSLLFQGAMMLIALFFFLVQRYHVVQWIDEASPLGKGHTHELMAEFRRVTTAVLRSTVLTAFLQAVVALIGYVIARVPAPFFFAAVTFFVAMIPAIGAAAVCLVAALFLLLTGHPIAAAFLAAWGILVVGLVDNVVKPLLIRGGVQMHGAVVFFALLGGLAAFGAIGLLVGPLAVALFVALLRIYRRDFGGPGPPDLVGRPALDAPGPG